MIKRSIIQECLGIPTQQQFLPGEANLTQQGGEIEASGMGPSTAFLQGAMEEAGENPVRMRMESHIVGLDVNDTHRTLLATTEHPHLKTTQSIPQAGRTAGYDTHLNEFKRIEVIQRMLSHHNGNNVENNSIRKQGEF